MKPGFKPGITAEIQITVTEDMCPSFDGIIVHRCYSTWSVAHHFELAARKVLVGYLDDEEEGVGSHVSVDHLAPCPVGRSVCIRAELVEVSSRQVICNLAAYDGDRLLARGRQVQVVMNKEHLKRHMERHH